MRVWTIGVNQLHPIVFFLQGLAPDALGPNVNIGSSLMILKV